MPGSVLITGASTGIGRALAFEFSRRGFALGLCARRLELLEELEEELSGENQVAVAHLDVAELESVPEVLNKLADELGGFILIIGARMAGGCTSGHILSGGMQFAFSSMFFSIFVFAGLLITGRYFYKK